MKAANGPMLNIGTGGGMKSERFLDRGPRLPVALRAVITAAGDDLVDVMITNLSTEGFAVDTPRSILIGSDVILSAPEIGERRANIRWALGSRLGGRFIETVGS